MANFLFNIGERIQRSNDIYKVEAHLENLYSLRSPSSGYTIVSPKAKVEREFVVVADQEQEHGLRARLLRAIDSATDIPDLNGIIDADNAYSENLIKSVAIPKPTYPIGGDLKDYEQAMQQYDIQGILRERVDRLSTLGKEAVPILDELEKQLGRKIHDKTFFKNFCDWVAGRGRVFEGTWIFPEIDGRGRLGSYFWEILQPVLKDNLKEVLPPKSNNLVIEALYDSLEETNPYQEEKQEIPSEKIKAAQAEAAALLPVFTQRAEVISRIKGVDDLFPEDKEEKAKQVKIPSADEAILTRYRDELFTQALKIKNDDEHAITKLKQLADTFDENIRRTLPRTYHAAQFSIQQHLNKLAAIIKNISEHYVNSLVRPVTIKQQDWLGPAEVPPGEATMYLSAEQAFKPSITPLQELPNEKIIRHPSGEDTKKEWKKHLRIWEFETAIANTPIGAKRTFGVPLLDQVELILNSNPNITLDSFHTAVRSLITRHSLRYLLSGPNLERKIIQLNEKIKELETGTPSEEVNNRLGNLRDGLEDAAGQLRDIKKFYNNISALHGAWFHNEQDTPEPYHSIPQQGIHMKKESNVKSVGNYFLCHTDKDVVLEIPELSASLKFSSPEEALSKFNALSTEEEVKTAFDIDTLIAVEAAAPELDLSQEIHPGTKGASAFDKKKIEEDMIPFLNALNLQGSEEDMKAKIEELLNEQLAKAGVTYKEDNIDWLVSTIYGAWRSQQPIPSEVGSEGKSNVGVANSQGTGVFVEPARGNDGITKKACDLESWKILVADAVKKEFADKKVLEEFNELAQKHEHMEDIAEAASPELSELLRMIKELSDAAAPLDPSISMNKEADLGIIARIQKKNDGWHVYAETGRHLGGPYKSKEAAQKRLQQVEMFKHMKSASGELMNFEVGDTAVLNNRVGFLNEGTEVTVTAYNDGEVTFVTGEVHGITKAANLDKVILLKEAAWTNCSTCGGKEITPRCMNCDGLGRMPLLKEAADSKMEKYQWDNDDLKSAYALGDRVKVGSFDLDGVSYKGKEGTIREKVIVSSDKGSETYFLVELDGCGSLTLPADVLSRGKKVMALNAAEFTKESVLKPNFDMVQEFLNSYDHPPTVVTTEDIEAWMGDPKNNYQYTKRDMKEIIKYLQSARVEVRVPVKKDIPELPEEVPMAKEAKKYKYTSPDGKTIVEKEVTDDMGPSFETDDPKNPGQKMKWTSSSLTVCADCSGDGVITCECMEDANIWMSAEECTKCHDYGTLKCKCAS